MAESRRVDLRLTIPVAAPYLDLARDLALKFAEYAGASQQAVPGVAEAVASAITALPRDRRSLELLLSADGDGEVTVTVTSTD
jgi:hypothetical protein